MKIANKFSHFHSASPGSVCHAMFVFYGFRPQCVHCNNYTTQSTQKEPRGSTSKKKWKEQIKNRTEIHSYPLTVGISHNRCRKKRRITSLAVLHKFHNLQISHVFGQKLGVNEHWPNGQWAQPSGKCWIFHLRMDDDGLAFKWGTWLIDYEETTQRRILNSI